MKFFYRLYSNRSGMTLTELLATICVMIIIVHLVTIGLKSAYQKTESAQCTSHLRQIGMAIHLYLADYDYFLPPPGRTSGSTWARTLIDGGYINADNTIIFSCPARPVARGYRINSGHNDGIGWEHGDAADGGPIDVSTISKPGETIIVSEYHNVAMTTDIDSNGTDVYTDTTMWGGNYPDQPTDALLAVHLGGSNYLFCDFHVEWLDKEDMKNDPHEYSWYTKP